MNKFKEIFGKEKSIIGMVHLLPLPGSPNYDGNIERVYKSAENDLQSLIDGGISSVIVENFHDNPYTSENELITYISMAHIATRLRQVCKLPMGINIQYNCTEAEWDIAYVCNYDFIRVEVFSENRCGPNGCFTAAGPSLMRLKRKYPKEIAILADVNVKHTFPLVDQPVDFTINSLVEDGADAIICTGITTGSSPSVSDVKEFKKYSGDVPVILGSGISKENICEFLPLVDGAIIGSSMKVNGVVDNAIDKNRVKEIMERVKLV